VSGVAFASTGRPFTFRETMLFMPSFQKANCTRCTTVDTYPGWEDKELRAPIKGIRQGNPFAYGVDPKCLR
jgi:hypothetical protein